MDLFYDYRTNVSLYPQWQKFLSVHQPKPLIFWGQNDIFFSREGGEAYLKDLPNAEMYRLDSGHFAVEDCLNEIAYNISRFYVEKVFGEGDWKYTKILRRILPLVSFLQKKSDYLCLNSILSNS